MEVTYVAVPEASTGTDETFGRFGLRLCSAQLPSTNLIAYGPSVDSNCSSREPSQGRISSSTA